MPEPTAIAILSDFVSKGTFASRPDNPLKKGEIDYLFRNRHSNGFEEAFVKVNAKNYLVHVPVFVRCLAERRDL